MATVEAETSRDERPPPGGPVYDGFVSYSHAADDLLAPRLQAGLQRFAKPWWKRRALRIFRDESSLSANPHLWSSITDALDQSAWFVLLLSPEAAESPWVNNEVEYWLEHKDPDRIIPVLTDGDFVWSGGDVAGDAVPTALQGAFSDEPRWVDLRFSRTEEQLDLNNPTFSATIADIASPMRGVPKDDLESEEVRQHRRTVRTAWLAGLVVLVLAVAAGGAALFAFGQRNEARAQTEVAQTERDRAVAAEDAASAAADSEAEQRAEAEQQARVAKSRELVAASVGVLGEDPELSMMLALESMKTVGASATAVETLREAMLKSHLLRRFEGGKYGRISPDGSTVYLADEESTLTAIEIDADQPAWLYEVSSGSVGRVAISQDGRLVAVQVHGPSEGDTEFQVVILNAASGAVVAAIDPGEGCRGVDAEGVSFEGDFSIDGAWFSVFTGTADCGRAANEGWVAVYDTATWEETHRLQTEDGMVRAADFSEDSSLVLLNSQGGVVELRSFPDLLVINRFDQITGAALSPDGSRVVLGDANLDFRPLLADSLTGTPINYLDPIEFFTSFEPFSFSADGTALAVTTRAHDFVFDGEGGRLLVKLGEQGPTLSHSLSAAG